MSGTITMCVNSCSVQSLVELNVHSTTVYVYHDKVNKHVLIGNCNALLTVLVIPLSLYCVVRTVYLLPSSCSTTFRPSTKLSPCWRACLCSVRQPSGKLRPNANFRSLRRHLSMTMTSSAARTATPQLQLTELPHFSSLVLIYKAERGKFYYIHVKWWR